MSHAYSLTEMLVLDVTGILLLALVQCEARGPCDPLIPEYCLLPFPNSFYTVPSNKTSTGLVVNLSVTSFPADSLNRYVHPYEWNSFDGFSPFPSIVAYFPYLDGSNLPPHWDIECSLLPTSPTILVNLKTGKLVPHFAELDTSFPYSSQNGQALMIWPSQKLDDDSCYVVCLRYLRTTNNTIIQPSKAFIALREWQLTVLSRAKGCKVISNDITPFRDNKVTTDPDIEYRRVHYQNLFNQLELLGIQRMELQLMWDFTTASMSSLTGRLIYMRDNALSRVGPDGPNYRVTEVNDNYSPHIFRQMVITMEVPLYLTSPLPGSHLVINDQGLPVYQTTADVGFTMLIPHSVANGSAKTPLLVQYGHGLFTDQNEVETEYLQEQANRYGYILVACDLWGLMDIDLPFIVYMLAENVSNFRIVPDRLTQAIVNELVLMRLMKGAFSKDPHVVFGGRQVIIPEECYFYGVSAGGVLGEVYMAATTDIKRGVLGVNGGPFGLLLPRNKDFAHYSELLRLAYPDPVDYITMLSAINMVWSRADPNAYMASITSEPLLGTKPHQVLYQYALGDAQVNLLGLYSVARSAGAKMYASNVKESYFPVPGSDVIVKEKLFGFNFVSDDVILKNDSLASGYDCGAPPEPNGNIPPNSDTDTHELPRRAKTAQEQIDLFLRYGQIKNFCNGPCNDCSSW